MSALDDSISTLTAQVTALKTVDESAIVLINGISQQVVDAVNAAMAAGASAEQLAALTDLSNTLGSEAASLGAAVVANTPHQTP